MIFDLVGVWVPHRVPPTNMIFLVFSYTRIIKRALKKPLLSLQNSGFSVVEHRGFEPLTF